MYLVDILNLAFSVQCNDCFASSFSPITAAWATQGYWMQATIIEYLGGSGLGAIAALIYAVAVGAGIVGYTLGSPPRNYLWYFLGPALFHFLLFTTEPSKGVAWQMGVNGNGAPILGNQTEVWKLAEVGLVNQENVLRRGVDISRKGEPSQQAEVSTVFLTIDSLFSGFIQGLVGLLGTKEMMTNRSAGDETNIPDVDSFNDFSAADFYRISNSKWGMLENITYASVKDINMTKSLAIFFGSGCGDTLVGQIDQAKYATATRARSGQLPKSIFKSPGATQDYKQLKQAMSTASPATVEPALKDMFPPATCDGKNNSLTCFSELTQKYSDEFNNTGTDAESVRKRSMISCDNYLSLLIEGMRWESGNAYYQLINSAPELMAPKYVLFNLFYGWGIRRLNANGVPTGKPLNAHEELIKYTPNLILLHILRNMMEFTPVTSERKFTPSDDLIDLTKYQQRNISSKTKFVEVYTWALMIPYIQGLVLYFLSIAYPVVCVAMLMPNLYKLPLTWIKFWFWAKSWDLGFAIVMAVDKSVWAMMSNSPKSQATLGYVAELTDSQYHPVKIVVECGADKVAGSPAGRGCAEAVVTDSVTAMGADPFTGYLMPIFDKAMILSKNLELDLANSYYIYIMAALYFAVPAVTGQLVGSIGGLASGALDKMTDVKAAANAGVTSDMNQRLNAFSQIAQQEKVLSTQRSADAANKAMQQNEAKGGDNGAVGAGQLAGRNAGGGAAAGPLGTGNSNGGGTGPNGNRVAGAGAPAGGGVGGRPDVLPMRQGQYGAYTNALAKGAAQGDMGGGAVTRPNSSGILTAMSGKQNPANAQDGQQTANQQPQTLNGTAAPVPQGGASGGSNNRSTTAFGAGLPATQGLSSGQGAPQGSSVPGQSGVAPQRPQQQQQAQQNNPNTNRAAVSPGSTMGPTPNAGSVSQPNKAAQGTTSRAQLVGLGNQNGVVANTGNGVQSGTSFSPSSRTNGLSSGTVQPKAIGNGSGIQTPVSPAAPMTSTSLSSPSRNSNGLGSATVMNRAQSADQGNFGIAGSQSNGASLTTMSQGMPSQSGSSSMVQSLANSGGGASSGGTTFARSSAPANSIGVSYSASSQPSSTSYAQTGTSLSSGNTYADSGTSSNGGSSYSGSSSYSGGSSYSSGSSTQFGSATTTSITSAAPSSGTSRTTGSSGGSAPRQSAAPQRGPQAELAIDTTKGSPIRNFSGMS